MKVKSESEVAQSCLTLSDPLDCSLGLQPRFLHPWDFPGKSTGVGCHCLLRESLEHNVQIMTILLTVPHVLCNETLLLLLSRRRAFSPLLESALDLSLELASTTCWT